jgi:hypothetical protein
MRVGVTWTEHVVHRAVVHIDEDMVADLAESQAGYRAIWREWQEAQARGEQPTLSGEEDEFGHRRVPPEEFEPYRQAQDKFWSERKGKAPVLPIDVESARNVVIHDEAMDAALKGEGPTVSFRELADVSEAIDLDHACVECGAAVDTSMYLYPPGLDDEAPDAATWRHDHEED